MHAWLYRYTGTFIARRAEELGMKIMVVFHYSDHFADPLIQDVPSEWEGASESELEQYVYDYTAYIMEQLAEEGVYPEWVQVGNEVSYGMLYPSGSNQTNDFTQLTNYLNSGYDAVKSVSLVLCQDLVQVKMRFSSS